MWFRTDNPIRDAEVYDMERQRELDRLPTCDICGEPIQGEFLYDINGVLHCEDCMKSEYLKSVDDYIE